MKYILSIIVFSILSVAALWVIAGPGHDDDENSTMVHEESPHGMPGHHDMEKKIEKHGHDEGQSGGHDSGRHGEGSHANAAGTPVSSHEKYDRLVNVTLLDTMRIEYLEALDVEPGTIVKFVVTNKGKIPHEFAISNAEEQKAHVEMMRKMPNMKHEDGSTVSLESGETKTLVWKFDGESEVVFSCNIPGHSEAGMLTKISLKGAHGNHDH